MEHITPDYWKGIVKGVVSTFITTFLATGIISMIKFGATLGYVASVILTMRGIVQLMCCFLQYPFSVNKTTKKRECNVFRIITDIQSIGILPRRTKVPLFDDSGILSRSDLYLDKTLSYSLLSTNTDNPEPLSPVTPITPIVHTTNAGRGAIMVIDKSSMTKTINFDHKRKPRTKSYRCVIWSAIIFRGFIGGIGILLNFEASMLLPVGDYLAFMALTATVTPIFAFIVFKDRLSNMHSISLIGAVIGVILIIQPPFIFRTHESMSKDIIYGYIYAFGVCVSLALVFVCIQFARKVPIYILNISQSIFCIITGIAVLSFDHQLCDKDTHWINNWFDFVFVVLIGLAGYTYLWLLTMAGRYLSSGVVAMLLNLSIVWGYLVQIFVFHEVPDSTTMIGATCMFLSAVIVSASELSEAKRKSMSVIERNATTNVGL